MSYQERYDNARLKVHFVRVGGSYQLVEDYRVSTSFRPPKDIITDRIHLLQNGLLIILSGYCSDGVSGPVIDRKTNMRAGFGHDAEYHLMRMRLLPHAEWRTADRDFSRWLKEDGAWKITRQIDMAGLKLAHGRAARPKSRRRVRIAP